MLAVKVRLCDSRKTKSGRPCRNRVPCSRHSLKAVGQRRLGRLDAAQRNNLVTGVLAGKDVRSAALDAGYSEATAQGRIYQIIKTPDMRERFKRIANDAAIDTSEIIGTLVKQMRFDIADLFPESDFMQQAKQLGISHLIKKVKVRQVVAGFDKDGSPIMGLQHEIEGYSALEAAKHLTKVFGLKDLPRPEVKAHRDLNAAVERVTQQAIAAGVKMPPEELRKEI